MKSDEKLFILIMGSLTGVGTLTSANHESVYFVASVAAMLENRKREVFNFIVEGAVERERWFLAISWRLLSQIGFLHHFTTSFVLPQKLQEVKNVPLPFLELALVRIKFIFISSMVRCMAIDYSSPMSFISQNYKT